MNVFKVLASAKKSFPEEQASAMLAWLLNPYMEHGLGFSFLKKFLELVVKDDDQNMAKLKALLKPVLRLARQEERVDFSIDIEDKVKNSFIDVVVVINKIVFSIENKIRCTSASDPAQLSKQYAGLKKKYTEAEKFFVIFLVPSKTDTQALKEFEALTPDMRDETILVEWDDIRQIITQLLDEEQIGNITPINEYTRHTLKAFSSFIQDDFSGYDYERFKAGNGDNPCTECSKTYEEVKKEGEEGDWVGVKHGLSGLIQDYSKEELKTKKFQYTTQDMEDKRYWIPKDVFLKICGCIQKDNFDGIPWQEYISSPCAEMIYRIAKATTTPLFIGISGGVSALGGMDPKTIRGKKWGISTEPKSSQWIPKDKFIAILEEKKVFDQA